MNPDLTEDRLSNLPKNVTEAILMCLPLRDAVRTSILSHGWRYEWSNLPQVVFDKHHFPFCENQTQTEYDSKLVKIVDQVLLLHRGPIHKFKLSTDLERCTDIDRWILFLSRNGIREFIVDKWRGQMYKVPSCLFSCQEITHLELYKCTLIPPASFRGFSSLTSLDLQVVVFSNDGLESLISNCPLLNKLKLRYIDGCTHLKLCAPSLVDISVEGAFENLCFEKTPVLVKASIKLLGNDEYQSFAHGSVCKLINILGYLPSIRRLDLLDHTLQIWAAGDVPIRLPTTCQLKHLSIDINFEDMQAMLAALCIFRSSTVLQKLDIKAISDKNRAGISVGDFWEAHEDFNCWFSLLEIVKVTEYTGTTSELKFIEFVLANAPVLEMVQIEFKQNAVDVLKIMRELIRFRRNSSKAEILLPE